MKDEPIARRRATNVTLADTLVASARELDVNISQACETGLAEAVRVARRERWKTDNAEWVQAHRRWVEANELPLDRYRLF